MCQWARSSNLRPTTQRRHQPKQRNNRPQTQLLLFSCISNIHQYIYGIYRHMCVYTWYICFLYLCVRWPSTTSIIDSCAGILFTFSTLAELPALAQWCSALNRGLNLGTAFYFSAGFNVTPRGFQLTWALLHT